MQSIDGNVQFAFRSDSQIVRQIQYSVVDCHSFVEDGKFKVCDFISLRRLFVHSQFVVLTITKYQFTSRFRMNS